MLNYLKMIKLLLLSLFIDEILTIPLSYDENFKPVAFIQKTTRHGPSSRSVLVFEQQTHRSPRHFIPQSTSPFYGKNDIIPAEKLTIFNHPLNGFGRPLETPEAMWPEGVFLPPQNLQDVEFDNPDPYLLSGETARQAVKYLYRKPLFFEDFPHARALINNNEQRQLNGLDGNYLSSNRHNSPFYRYRKNYL